MHIKFHIIVNKVMGAIQFILLYRKYQWRAALYQRRAALYQWRAALYQRRAALKQKWP
jgi:hypothetical protein